MADPTFTPLLLQKVAMEHDRDLTTVTVTFKSFHRSRNGGVPQLPLHFSDMPLDELGELLADMAAAYVHRLNAIRVQE